MSSTKETSVQSSAGEGHEAASEGAQKPARKSQKTFTVDEHRRLREAELLLNVTSRLASFDSLDEVLVALVEMTTEELGTERSSIFLHAPSTLSLSTYDSSDK